MRFLVSNDDGIYAEGIKVLRKTLEELGEVTVVAPDRERSATGHGITVYRPLRTKKIKYKNSTTIGYAVDGTPADCVKLGLEAIMDKAPDLVISGINLGPNLGTDVLYSGTVSAAYEGIINGIPSMAISINTWENPDYTYAVEFIKEYVPEVIKRKLPRGVLLNVNIPNGIRPKGIRVSRLGYRRYIDVFDKRTDPRGKTYFWMAGEPENLDEDDPETDVYAVKEGYISVTPIQIDVTSYQYLEELKKWPINK
ncbi:5'-nucleotidase [Desulfohalotomaculum tongense]|uniref:5'/3'-nucleotidase SurE n=1 Tax=Desulforadius tongensis TaxID=1216062 RepID=UPI00195C5313|nr:5'/3'-nucleotidase SurE [Desulforadius tongensis]MBM7855282.1 5'-nucleotidase [Desulforadius tongensis]